MKFCIFCGALLVGGQERQLACKSDITLNRLIRLLLRFLFVNFFLSATSLSAIIREIYI